MIRIIILEDRASDKELMEFELQEAGIAFTSLWAKTEKEYIQALEGFPADLILSDYDLPQYNGARALAEARRRCAGVPFILVTGALDDNEDRAREILSAGACDYILKSRLDRLAPAVRKTIGTSSLTHSVR